MCEPNGMQTFFRVLSKAGRMRSWVAVLPIALFWEYTEILHQFTVKKQGDIRVEHGNATMGFNNADV